jgi:hypothetical protein
MTVHITIFSVMWLNFFPSQGGWRLPDSFPSGHPDLSPQAILTGICVDHDKHCRIPFGGYAQVHAEPTPTNNTMESHTVGGVSLRPTGNIQGSYHFLSLLTGHRIKARLFAPPLTMPTDVIVTVESFAPADGVREPVFEVCNGHLDWETDTDDANEYHDAQEYIPLEDQDVPLRPDAAITAAELQALTADATAHGEIPGVNTDDENDETTDDGPTDTDASSNKEEPELVGIQDEIPGVQDAIPGVQRVRTT